MPDSGSIAGAAVGAPLLGKLAAMGNLGGMEVVVILLVALIVLGPTKLPEAARQVGKAMTELRRVSGGFQRELREAIQDPIREVEAMARGADLEKPTPSPTPAAEPEAEPEPTDSTDADADPESSPDSTAAD